MQNKTVLITGATSGIGFAMAGLFAQEGYNLVLAASSRARLDAAKAEIQAGCAGASIQTHAFDLSRMGSAFQLYEAVQHDGLHIDILVNNAGFGLVGPTEQIPMERDEALMVLNAITPVALCKLFLPGMYAQGRGKILNVASTGAFQPGPYTATYFASKAFLLSYSEAVRYEAAAKGVQVCALCPGATRTNFFTAEGAAEPKGAMTAEAVAHYGYERLMENQAVSIPGLRNWLAQLAPKRLKIRAVAKLKAGEGR